MSDLTNPTPETHVIVKVRNPAEASVQESEKFVVPRSDLQASLENCGYTTKSAFASDSQSRTTEYKGGDRISLSNTP